MVQKEIIRKINMLYISSEICDIEKGKQFSSTKRGTLGFSSSRPVICSLFYLETESPHVLTLMFVVC